MQLEQRVMAVVASVLMCPAEQLTRQDGLNMTSGWDSLAHLEVINRLEEEFGCRFTVEETLDLETISDIVTVLSPAVSE